MDSRGLGGLQGYVDVYAYRTPEDARERRGGQRVFAGHNAQTQRHLQGIVSLLRQGAGVSLAQFAPHSVWFEMDPTDTLAASSITDTGPSELCVVEHQYEFEDDDKAETVVQTVNGPQVALRLTSYVDGATWGGRVIAALGLYSRGTAGLPDPSTWTSGTDDVYLLARAVTGLLTVPTGLTLEFVWTLAFVHLENDVL